MIILKSNLPHVINEHKNVKGDWSVVGDFRRTGKAQFNYNKENSNKPSHNS